MPLLRKHRHSVSRYARRDWPLLANLAALWACLCYCLIAALIACDGHFAYALDDAYIHMAIARNVAQHGLWGVSPFAFSSASSSPFWTLLIAAIDSLLGPRLLVPVVVNAALATLLLIQVYHVLRRQGLPQCLAAIVLLVWMLVTPVPALVFSGMEHILHLILSIAFVCAVAGQAAPVKAAPRLSLLAALAALVVSARYEGLFLVFAAACYLAWQREWRQALVVAVSGVVPVAAYGAFSLSQGGYLFPNSILLKAQPFILSSAPDLQGPLVALLVALIKSPPLALLLMGGIIFLVAERRHPQRAQQAALVLFLASGALHTVFARIGNLFRYEAYLIAMGVLFLAGPASILWTRARSKLHIAIALLLLGPFVHRAYWALVRTPQAMTNIYQQQVQMALFVQEHYSNRIIAVNDIGAISFIGQVRCVDLLGLATQEVARARRARTYTAQFLTDLVQSQRATIAIVYDRWLEEVGVGKATLGWFKVGEWQISQNVACGDDTVSFYALDAEGVNPLLVNLRLFSARLPTSVRESGVYLSEP